METTSAHRRPQQPTSAFPIGWVLGGLGIIFIITSMYFQYSGPVAWRGVLHSQDPEAADSVFVTEAIALEPETYSFDLSFRKPPKFLEITTGRYHVRITSEHAPNWQATGSLKAIKKKKNSGRRATVRGTLVSEVSSPIDGPLKIEVDGAGNSALTLRIQKVGFDYRILLWIGIGLIGLGLALDQAFRSRLQALLGSG